MARNTEAVLRVRAKNLATKDLREVSSELDSLADSQKKNATASGLASRALRELTDEQKDLAAISKELQRRGGLIGNLGVQKQNIDELRKKLVATKAELERLASVKSKGGFGTANIDKQLGRIAKDARTVQTEINRATKALDSSVANAAKLGITFKNSAAKLTEINGEIARTEQLTRGAAAAVDSYNVNLQQSKAALAAQEAAQKAITAEAQRRNVLEGAAAAQRRAEAAALLARTRELGAMRQQFTKGFLSRPAPAAEGPKPVFGPGGDAAAIAAAREAGVRERLVNKMRDQAAESSRLYKLNGRLKTSTDGVTAALDRNNRSMDRSNHLGGIFSDTGRKSLSVYQRLRGQLLATAAAYVGFYQAVGLVTSAVTAQQERMRIEIQLKVANKGDVAAATRDQKFLREEADRLGLVYEDVAKNFANFKVAARSVGASNNTIKTSFVDATTVVQGLALSTEDADGVFRAFVQIMGKARVQAEELRGQLGDRLPGAVAKFAEANNIALSDLDAYLKKGKGSVQNFLTFLKAYAAETKGAAEENSKTLFAQLNRLKNAYRDFLVVFAKAGTSSQLLKIVNEIIAKLKGEDGGKFARDLADAFVLVGRGILWVIKNFDTFVKVVKAFLALQLLKAVVGIGGALLNFGYNAYKAAKAVVVWTAAMNAARIAGTGLTVGMRGLLLLAGPVGWAIAALAGTFYLLTKNGREATAEIDRLIGKTRQLRTATGQAGVAAMRGAANEIRTIGAAQAELIKKRDNLLKGGAFIRNVTDPIASLVDAAADSTFSVAGLNREIELNQAKIGMLEAAAIAAGKRITKEAKAEAAQRAKDAAEQDDFEKPKGETDKDADAAAKRAAAEAAAKERLAEKILDINDRAAKELLEIESALQEARLAAEIRTQEQIDSNFAVRMAVIDNDIKKKIIELEALAHDAERIGATDAAGSANAALAKLPALRAEMETKARTEAITASIELKERNINALIAARDGEIERINSLVEAGLLDEIDARAQIVALQAQSKDAITAGINELILQLETLKASDPDLARALNVDALIQKLEITKIKAGELESQISRIGKNLGGQFAGGMSAAFGTLIKGLAGGIEGVNGIGDAFKNAGASFMEFLANFLIGIGQAILQAIILKAIMNALSGGTQSGGYMDAAMGALTGHTGGVVRSSGIGSGNPTRQVSTALFAGAQRFHDGGLPGLKSGEVPAILKTGEEVLTEDDPRNVLNGAQTGGGQPNIDLSIHNSIDSASVVSAGLSSRAGRKAFFNAIQAEKESIKRILA